jgi:hypothetical protein
MFQIQVLNLIIKITIMRYIVLIVVAGIFLGACKKDKFNTVPQISFVSMKPDFYRGGLLPTDGGPELTLHVTDAEGDLGFVSGKDTSKIYIKNLRTTKLDSAFLPDIKTAASKNFQADIIVDMKPFLGVPNNTKRDTIYYEVYIKDFAKNKSNIIKTDKPIYYIP